MKQMELEKNNDTRAPRPENLDLPGFFKATDGSICTIYCGSMIKISHIAGTDAVYVALCSPAAVPGLYETEWEEECLTHDKMVNFIRRMCASALEKARARR